MPTEVLNELNHWDDYLPLARVLCRCGRAYVIDPAPGEPCRLCRDEMEADYCGTCRDTGIVYAAGNYANERDAERPCPDCCPGGWN